MFSSRRTKDCVLLLIIVVVLINAVSLEARRMFGGFGGRGRFGGGRPSGRPSRPNFGRPGLQDMMDIWSMLEDPYLDETDPEPSEEEFVLPEDFANAAAMPWLSPFLTLESLFDDNNSE